MVAGPDAATANLDPLRDSGKQVHLYEELLEAAEATFDWPDDGRARRRRDVLHLRHDRQPEGRRLQPPLGRTCTRWRSALGIVGGLNLARPGAADRADVPRQRLGPALRRDDDRRLAGDAGPVAAGRAAVPVHARGRPTVSGAVPTVWNDVLAYLDEHADLELVLEPQAGALRRLGRPGRAAEGARRSGTASRCCRPGA